MQDSSKEVVVQIIEKERPLKILDAPCGMGWLRDKLKYECDIDGVDLFEVPGNGYRNLSQHDLDHGLPDTDERYDCICTCEGIEHFGNPLLFLECAQKQLTPGGLLIVTTPNTWYPGAKLKYFSRGFHPSFPCLVGKIKRGTHMHITPWSYPQLYLYLKLLNFVDIQLHKEPLSRCQHGWERLLGIPQKLYCKGKKKKAETEDERDFWETAGTEGSVFGRHLIMTARKGG